MGDWSGVDEIRALWTAEPPGPTLTAVSEAVQGLPIIDDLRNNALTPDKLLAFNRTGLGRAMLRDEALRNLAWKVIRPVWSQPETRREFPDLIEAHFEDLIADLRQRAATTPRAWFATWDAMKDLIAEDRRRAIVVGLIETVRSSRFADKLSPEQSAWLLRQWTESHQRASTGQTSPPELHWLLPPVTTMPDAAVEETTHSVLAVAQDDELKIDGDEPQRSGWDRALFVCAGVLVAIAGYLLLTMMIGRSKRSFQQVTPATAAEAPRANAAESLKKPERDRSRDEPR